MIGRSALAASLQKLRPHLTPAFGRTLLVALPGGAVFWALNLPLPWMLGAVATTTIASMAGARMQVSNEARAPMVAVLGVLLGSSFTEEVAAGIPGWWPTMLGLPLYIAVSAVLGYLYLRRFARFDPVTAWFAGFPGGLGELSILGDRMGGDVRSIALVHAARVLIVVFAVPFGIRWLGDYEAGASLAGRPLAGATDLALMALAGVVGYAAAWRLRLPAPGLLGPMVVSALAHLTGVVHGAPPLAAVAAAQLVIGASVGARFQNVALYRLTLTFVLSAVLIATLLAVSAVFALLLSTFTGLPFLLVFLAYVPGGLAEMSLIALALTPDPAFVAAHHIVRIALVVFMAPLLLSFVRRFLP